MSSVAIPSSPVSDQFGSAAHRISGKRVLFPMYVDGQEVQKSCAVVIHKKKLILVQREAWDTDASGKKSRVVWWELPGGKADHSHESAVCVAAREVREETGARVHKKDGVFLGIGEHPQNHGRISAIFDFSCHGGKIHNAAPHEHLSVHAFSPKKLERLVRSADVRVPEWVLIQFTQTGEVHTHQSLSGFHCHAPAGRSLAAH